MEKLQAPVIMSDQS